MICMRTIERTRQFKRDYKRESKGRYRATLDASLERIFDALANDQTLDRRHCDHPLRGKLADCRDCHVKPDLVLMYKNPTPIRYG